MDIRNPSPPELTDLVNKISAAFSYNKEEAGVERDFPQLYNQKNSRNLWVAFEGSQILGHAGFYPTEMQVEGLPLPVAGIGGVFVDPAFQGQGLATQLVEKCVLEASKQGSALAFLWSDKHEFYARQGFHLLGRQWTIELDPPRAQDLKAAGEKSGIAAGNLRFVEGGVSADFLEQSHRRLQQYSLGIARSPEEHGLLLGSGACRVFSAWAGKSLAAYFVLGKGHDLQDYVHEWAGETGALHQLAAHCLEHLKRRLYVLSPQFMPDEVPWIYALDELGIPMRAEQMGLVKLLDFPKVQRLVADYMRRIGLPPEDLVLERSGDSFTVEWRENTRLSFPEAEFQRFLFGPEMPAHPELKAFLPLRLWYWGMDSV